VIVKEKDFIVSTSRLAKAGEKAEKDMAHFLKREFAHDKDVWVFHDLRIRVDDKDFAQMDHLVMHRHGFVIIESKSVCDSVEVNEYGEWARLFNGKLSGMPSPVEQAKRQAKVLSKRLQSSHEELRGKSLGLMQRSFDGMPFDVITAISTNGRITGSGRAKFNDMVFKADQVCEQIRAKSKHYGASDKHFLIRDDEWPKIVHFLKGLHQPKQSVAKNKTKYEKPKTKRPAQVSEPSPVKKSISKPQDYWTCSCGKPFEIRHKHSFYRYCSACKKILKLSPKCPECDSEAILSQPEGTRIITYTCKGETQHQGVFRANQSRYKKDEITLRGKS